MSAFDITPTVLLGMALTGFAGWFGCYRIAPVLGVLFGLTGGVGAAGFALVSSAVALEPPDRDAAKAEARELFDGLRSGAESNATMTVDADSVPGFVTDDPDGLQDYYDNPSSMDGDGRSVISGAQSADAAGTSTEVQGAIELTRAEAVRPSPVSAAELAEWTTNGFAIEANAQNIVREYGGAYGDCTVAVTGGAGGTTYTYTCDSGETVVDYQAACANILSVTSTTEYVYRAYDRYLAGDCSYDRQGPEWQLISENGTCGPIEQVGTTDTCRCGERCEPRTYETVCRSPIPELPIEREIPGEQRDSWDASSCEVHEVDANCRFTGEICTSGPETRVVDGAQVTRDCWEVTRTYQCTGYGGEANDCDPPSGCTLSGEECLALADDGTCLSTEKTYTCTVAGDAPAAAGYCDQDVYCIAGDCETITREQNNELPDAIAALNAMGQAGGDNLGDPLKIFPGEAKGCEKVIAGLQNCCTDDGLGVTLGFDCSPDDRELALRKEDGQCAYVGTYCSDKLLGVCTKKRKSYCCFNSKLAKLIHEQGRPQLGTDFGDEEDPDCEGFLVEAFQQLDLSAMDLSEFYGDVLGDLSAPDSDAATADITARIISTYGN